ncbi:COG4223 family protein [Paracoccus spongiarum]|uniref:Phage tail protein n=1 Tax=Paracoccus spongiarum TaxID=3064387 RepID=A0ABT9JCD6_9RHOB|nr:hypothetical protein [Paracoccus sp. 2205BS29-5]MDP5307466.1 hypothetical protein [Paracoccus sp. 2205BS29-5]
MKKPDEKKPSSDSKSEGSEKPAAATAETVAKTGDATGRKAAAAPGTLASSATGPGDGASARAGAGSAEPIESSLLGTGKDGRPAAAPKSAATDAGTDAGKPAAKAAPAGSAPAASATAAAAAAAGAGAGAGAKDPASPTPTGKPAAEATKPGTGAAKPAADAAAQPPSLPADAGPRGPLKDTPPEAILRDTPAASPAPTQNVTVRKAGFWPTALGGAVAAGLGAAAALWALPHLPAGWLPADPAAEAAPAIDAEAIRAEAVSAAETAARDAARLAAREEIDALLTEIAGQPFTPAEPGSDPAPAESGTATAEAPAEPATGTAAETAPEAPPAEQVALVSAEDLAALQARLDEQAARIEELAARPSIDPAVAERVQSLADQAGALEQQIQSAAENAQSEITAAQAEAQKLQEAAEESTRRAEAVAAITALQAALDRGVTPDEARQTLEGAGLDAPEALTREVPSLESLQAGFGEAARAGLRAALRNDSAEGGGNLLTNFLRAQTGARSVTPREGDDPDAILSRADAAVEAGRIDAALTEVAALPDPAREAPAMAAWIADATAYRDAQAALSDLSANSN